MKKCLYGLVILLTINSGPLYATRKDPVSEKVRMAFQKEFSNATNVNWMPRKEKNLFHARFQYNDETVEAFFSEEGNLVTTARFISERQVPLIIMKEWSSAYSGYRIRQVVEFASENETSYVISGYNNKETVVVKYYSNGDSQKIRRIKNKS